MFAPFIHRNFLSLNPTYKRNNASNWILPTFFFCGRFDHGGIPVQGTNKGMQQIWVALSHSLAATPMALTRINYNDLRRLGHPSSRLWSHLVSSQLIHMSSTESVDEFSYYVFFFDHHSKYMSLHPMTPKSDTSTHRMYTSRHLVFVGNIFPFLDYLNSTYSICTTQA